MTSITVTRKPTSIIGMATGAASVFLLLVCLLCVTAASAQGAGWSTVKPALGGSYTCGVTTTGKGYCWGSNLLGGATVPADKAWKSITGGTAHSCGITTTGEGLCWGNNTGGQATIPAGKTWELITTGRYHSCGVTTTGEGLCWGNNDNGQRAVPSGKTWTSIRAGGLHSCGVTTTGEALCWGDNTYGQTTLPTGKTWASLTPGNYHSCGVTTTGEGLCWGANGFGQSTLPTGKTWASITPGSYHSCGVTTTGEGLCWGNIFNGSDIVPSGKTWSSIAAGSNHSCGVTTTGEGLCWGSNGNGQRTLPDITAPAAPGSFTGVPSANTRLTSATVGFTLGETDGTVECRADSGSWGACTSVTGTSGSHSLSSLAEGSHTVSVRQTDAAGNVSDIGTSSSWAIDTTAPAAPVISGAPSGTTISATASVSFSGESGATFTCSVDGGAFLACSSPKSLTDLATGSHSVSVKATDAAGNVSLAGNASWSISAPAAPRILTPAVGTKTVVKKTVGSSTTWAMQLGLLFSTGGDIRPAAQLTLAQVAVDSSGKPVSTKPSNTLSIPTTVTFTKGVVVWNPTGEVSRQTKAAPVWVRVGNKSGKWTSWVKLTL